MNPTASDKSNGLAPGAAAAAAVPAPSPETLLRLRQKRKRLEASPSPAELDTLSIDDLEKKELGRKREMDEWVERKET